MMTRVDSGIAIRLVASMPSTRASARPSARRRAGAPRPRDGVARRSSPRRRSESGSGAEHHGHAGPNEILIVDQHEGDVVIAMFLGLGKGQVHAPAGAVLTPGAGLDHSTVEGGALAEADQAAVRADRRRGRAEEAVVRHVDDGARRESSLTARGRALECGGRWSAPLAPRGRSPAGHPRPSAGHRLLDRDRDCRRGSSRAGGRGRRESAAASSPRRPAHRPPRGARRAGDASR